MERIAIIFNEFSHKSLDVADWGDGAKIAGDKIQQFGFHSGPNQRWRVNEVQQGVFSILSVGSGLAITIDAPNTIVQRGLDPDPISAGDFGQLWQLESVQPEPHIRGVRKYFVWSTKNLNWSRRQTDGKLLALKSPSASDNIEVELQSFQQGSDSQIWEFLYKLEPRISYIGRKQFITFDPGDPLVMFNVNSQKCIEVPSSSPTPETVITQMTYGGLLNQFWHLLPGRVILINQDAYQIMPLHIPGMALELSAPFGTPASMLVVQRQRVNKPTDPSDRDSFANYSKQLWFFHVEGDNFLIYNSQFTFERNPLHGNVLDVLGANLVDGGQVQEFPAHLGPAQLFDIWVSELYSG